MANIGRPAEELSKKTTISLPPLVFEKAKNRMKQLGYTEFSDYVQDLMRVDTGMVAGASMIQEMPSAGPGMPPPVPVPVTSYRRARRKKG